MASLQQITDTLIQESIAKSVHNVCHTLMRYDAKLCERMPPEAYEANPLKFQLIGNVGFAGEANGVVYLCMSDEFALFAVGTILGMSESEVKSHGPEVIKDAIGEITNMTVGGFKNALCDVGFPCMLSLPSIVRGDGLSISTLRGTTRYVFRFSCNNHPLIVDIQLKTD